MKKTLLFFSAATLLLASCNNTNDGQKEMNSDTAKVAATTEPAKADETWVPIDSATMMKDMMAYGTPGDMQKMMASWDGTWLGDMTTWDYEGATPHKMKGTAVYAMVLGGRYQSSTHKGDMMGMPFEGHGLMGYDNATKKFVDTWVDNWSTGIMQSTGDYDAATKTITLRGQTPDISRPGKYCDFKELITIVDDNTQKMEMYCPDPKTGKQFKMMEILSTRKK